MISLYNNIYWSCSLSLFIVCDNIFPLADFDLTSSLRRRSRFLFLLQIFATVQQRMLYSFSVLSVFHFTHSFAVCSVMWWTCVSWCDCGSMICWWRLSFVTIGRCARAHQQRDRTRHQCLSLVSPQLVSIVVKYKWYSLWFFCFLRPWLILIHSLDFF